MKVWLETWFFLAILHILLSYKHIQRLLRLAFMALKQLKWHYAQFSLQKMECNSYIFQKIAIYND